MHTIVRVHARSIALIRKAPRDAAVLPPTIPGCGRPVPTLCDPSRRGPNLLPLAFVAYADPQRSRLITTRGPWTGQLSRVQQAGFAASDAPARRGRVRPAGDLRARRAPHLPHLPPHPGFRCARPEVDLVVNVSQWLCKSRFSGGIVPIERLYQELRMVYPGFSS